MRNIEDGIYQDHKEKTSSWACRRTHRRLCSTMR